ncbi:hypothetical protein EZS27_036004 [termite gut metagenome]|uniref:AAA+ ATPase domain-containing protein n=1 Tax=termite gut metagenome TaxID=433724 RepID=A0A5J4PXW1_9ZZZZ
MARAYSVKNVLDAEFETLPFEGIWKSAVGCPELTGSWIVYGPTKNGKTTFAMMLAKYLTRFEKVFYNSVEEGLSRSVQIAYERVGMIEASGRITLERESLEKMIERLLKRKSPNVVFVDSFQFMGMTFKDYKRLKAMFPRKLFVFVSHVANGQPDGKAAIALWRDASVSFKVEGFRAIPVSRYEGGQYIDIDAEKAAAYWITGQKQMI